MPLTPGTRIRRYEVTDLLGAGGMGEVYLARDVELGRAVALKILPTGDTVHDDQLVHRFLQEAKAAISLSHPNVAHIYDAGDENGVRFLAMEYVQGETLRQRFARGPLPLDEALEIMLQVSSALASAHAAGIVHRDVKPENVMLRPDGYVKVLDFGLAKLTASSDPDSATQVVQTAPGVVMGTMHYMSPEQLRGSEVDARADVFSLGVMLYELVSGRRPFQASTPSGVIAAILTEEPPPVEGVPPELGAVIGKSLAKDPDERYASAREFGAALKKARGDTHGIRSGDIPTQVVTNRSGRLQPAVARLKPGATLLVVSLLVIAALAVWLVMRQRKIAAARAQMPQVEKLIEERRFFEAWDLATSLQKVLGNEEQLTRALQKMSEELTITTEPAGASVYLERVLPDGSTGARELAGTTPMTKHLIARGDYIVTVEKEGFAQRRQPLSRRPLRIAGGWYPQPAQDIKIELRRSGDVPAGMVFVDGGTYALTGWLPITDRKVRLDPFFIDRYEVSNRDFEQFIRAGGYRKRELWKHPFVKDGRTLTFEEAMTHFRDATGLPGPRGWAQGKYPQGRENHPVADITWHEAAAFAEYAGKKLPTIYQWDKAARHGVRSWAGMNYPWGMVESGGNVTTRANFSGTGPMPVDSLPSGMSAWGVHHLAGNVAELLRNRLDDGVAATGGGFDDPTYQFGAVASFPAFFSSPQLGFRCVRETTRGDGDQGAFALVTKREPPPPRKWVSDAEFAQLQRVYDYERTPLQAKLVERIDTADWVREKIAYTGARGQTAFLYLYLPKGVRPPYQLVQFAPASDVWQGRNTLPAALERTVAGIIRGGRAVFGVVLEGFREREDTGDEADFAQHVIDVRRALDYLEGRNDVMARRVGYYNPSASTFAFVLTAVDDRYAAVAFIGTAYAESASETPEQHGPNFVPRIRAPKIVFHGKYDEVNPLWVDGQPLFEDMREPKELNAFEGGHIASNDWFTQQLIAFLDKHLGPPS